MIYALDQEKERERELSFRSDRVHQNISASVWRWIDYHTEFLRHLGKRPKGENEETILTSLTEQDLIIREETGREVAHPRIQMTRQGRKLVREAHQIEPKRLGGLSEKQTLFADAIINAGLASREEVLAAFKDRTSKGREQIEAWRIILSARRYEEREKAQVEYLKSLERFEPCAYPGCKEKIKIRPLWGGGETPQPARMITLTYQVPGWHYEYRPPTYKKVRVPNTKTVEMKLYACSPRHADGVFRLEVSITLAQNEQEEARLTNILYPVETAATQREITDLAAITALDYVAQGGLEATFPRMNEKIRGLARQYFEQLQKKTEISGKQFTDDLEGLYRIWEEMFLMAYKDGLSVRKHIIQEGSQSYRQDKRWQPLYALLDRSEKQP